MFKLVKTYFNATKNFTNRSLVDDDNGNVKLWTLFSVSLLALFIYYGQTIFYILGIKYSSTLAYTIIALLVLATLFSLGCTLHMAFIGDENDETLKKDLVQKFDELQTLIGTAQNRINRVEINFSDASQMLTPKGVNSLSFAKKIVRSLETRHNKISTLLSTNSKISLMDAYDLFNENLDLKENSMVGLIDMDPLNTLSPEEWSSKLNNYLDEVDLEIQKIA